MQMATLPAALTAAPTAGGERRAGILAVGACLPEGILTNAELEAMVDTSDTWIMERTGIRLRHRATAGETTSEMGTTAAPPAPERAGEPPGGGPGGATRTPPTPLPPP